MILLFLFLSSMLSDSSRSILFKKVSNDLQSNLCFVVCGTYVFENIRKMLSEVSEA